MVAPGSSDSCPQCGAPASPEDFQCPKCELLLNFSAQAERPQPVTEPSIVRALLAPPERRPTGEIPAIPGPGPARMGSEGPTARYTVPMDAQTYPHVRGGVELASKLHDFEAYVISFVDGAANVPALAAACQLAEIEVQVILKSLLERGVVELHRKEAAPLEADAEADTDKGSWYEDLQISAEFKRPKGYTPLPPAAPLPKPAPAPPERRPPLPVTPSRGTAREPPPMAPLQKVTGARGGSREVAAPLDPAPRGNQPANVIERAVALERRGQIDGAIHVLRRAIAGVHHPAPLYNKLALILVHQRKDFGQAEELLRKAAALEPHNHVYQQNLYKVLALAAAGGGGKGQGGGFLKKLIRGKG